jgi:dTDP-4-amino-4,6-dideoxygalactose transaminase
MYYVLLHDLAARTSFIERLKSRSIHGVFHYVPLHSSPYGRTVGRAVGELPVTDAAGDRLVRLPLWLGIEEHQREIVAGVLASIDEAAAASAGAHGSKPA